MKKIASIKPVVCCAPGAPTLPGRQREELARRFKALADPTRLGIVNMLAREDAACVCHFERLGVSQPTVSHHLKVLREAGLIEVAKRRGTWTFYRLVPDAVESLAFALGGSDRPQLVLATAEGSTAG
jgi:ArsR family transcriptional regulator